ncbi:hypothetical protein NKH18_42955 [Streptomyces sp. M10(2022)]
MPVGTTVLLRDKVAQKAAVRAAGMPVAATWTVDDLGEIPGLALDFPYVVKPCSAPAASGPGR